MMIFFKTLSGSPLIQPIIVFDATRSDDIYTPQEQKQLIEKWLGKFRGRELPDQAFYFPESIKTFSLDYENAYTHNAIQLANSLKAKFSATIKNPPGDLVSLLKIEQYTSKQNIEALTTAVNNVIDTQVSFPAGVVIYRDPNQTPKVKVERPFTVYSTPYNATVRLDSTTLQIFGASYTDVVMKLQFAVDLTKRGDETIEQQLKKFESTLGYKIVFKTAKSRRPAVSKYYSPMPVNKLFSEICKDNNLGFTVTEDTFFFHSLSPKEVPIGSIVAFFSMRNSKPGRICTPPTLSDYATAEFITELHDPDLFSQVGIFDDSGSPTLLSNLSKEPNPTGAKHELYKFYVLAYTLTDGRGPTIVRYTATNNWLISYIKLDAILESKVFLQGTA